MSATRVASEAPAPTRRGASAGELGGVFLLCAGALAFEVAVSRNVAVQSYGRMGDVAIGSALFGYALAGTAWFASARLRKASTALLGWSAGVGAAAAMVIAHLVTAGVALDFARIFAAPASTAARAAVWILVFTAPLFASGLAVVALLGRRRASTAKLYGADLAGAGCGSAAVLFAFPLVGGAGALWWAAAVSALGGALLAPPRWQRRTALGAALALAVGAASVAPRIGVVVHAAKRGYLEDRNAGRLVERRWSAVSRVDVAEAEHARRLWFDGGSMQSLLIVGDARVPPALLVGYRENSMTLPYQLRRREHALVLASAGGNQVRAALRYETRRVTAVEVDPSVCDLVRTTYDDFLGGLFRRPEVELVNEEGRGFLRRATGPYDVIQLESAFGSAMLATGAAGTWDSYLLTVEAFAECIDLLTDDGVLYVAQNHLVRLFATALAALDRLGLDPRGRLYAHLGVDSLGRNVLLVRRTPFPDEEADVLARHARETDATVYYAPERVWELLGPDWSGEAPDEAGRRTLATLARHGAEERSALLASLAYDALPATDDRPFYNRFVRPLGRVPPDDPRAPVEVREMLDRARALGPRPIGDLPPVVVLALAAVLALPVVVLPWRRLARSGRRSGGLRAAVYFAAIGIGFVTLEVLLTRRFVLFLGSPTGALAVVLGGFLFFAGLGSRLLARPASRIGRGALAPLALAALALLYALWLDDAFASFAGAPAGARFGLALLLLAPVGCAAGVPLPVGLALLAGDDERRIAWGWAVSGYAAVTATAATGLFVPWTGYRAIFLLVAAAYVVAGVSLGRLRYHSRPLA